MIKRLALLVALTAGLAACGGDSKSAAPATTAAVAATDAAGAAPATTAPTAPQGTDAASTDTINVAGISDMPEECQQLLVDAMKQMEPIVSGVDWSTATMTDFNSKIAELDPQLTAIGEKMSTSGCDKYNPVAGDDALFAEMVKIAGSQAPGTVGFFTFMRALAAPTDTIAAPADCDSAIAAAEAALASGKKASAMTPAELGAASQALTAVATTCPADKAAEFMQRDDVQAFSS